MERMTSEEIDNLLIILNEPFSEKENDDIFGFSYETNGWYECIKFNDNILWDNEDNQAWLNERPDFDSDSDLDDYDSDIEGCIKRRFNDYVNKLKSCRFNVKTKKLNSDSFDAVDAIFTELNKSKKLNTISPSDEDEVFQTCVNILEKYN